MNRERIQQECFELFSDYIRKPLKRPLKKAQRLGSQLNDIPLSLEEYSDLRSALLADIAAEFPELTFNESLERLTPILDEFDHAYLRGLFGNIEEKQSEHERIEAELRENEEKYKSLYKSMSEAVALSEIIYSADGKPIDYLILDVNPTFEEITGLNKDDVEGKRVTQLYSTEEAPFLSEFNEVAENGKTQSFTVYFPPLEKHLKISAFSPGKGKFAALFADISEQVIAEQDLLAHQQRLNMATVSGKVGIWDLNLDTDDIYLHPNLKAMLGYKDDEIENRLDDWAKLDVPEDQPKIKAALNAHLNGDTDEYVCEHRMIHKDGSIRWFLGRGTAFYDDSGKPIRVLGADTDITDRKLVEDALRESEERFKSIYENLAIGFYRTTPDGRILMANPALLNLLGYKSLDELLDRDLEESGFIPQYPRDEFKEIIERDGMVIGYETAWIKKDGDTVYLRESARLIRDPQGNIEAYEGTVEDITAHIAAELELRRVKEFNENILNSISEGIVVEDVSGKFIYTNPAASKLLGYSEKELRGMHWTKIIPKDLHEYIQEVNTRRAEGASDRYEVEFLNKKRERIPVLVSGSPRLDNDEFVGTLAVLTNISAQKEVEAALRDSEEKFKRLSEASTEGFAVTEKGKFLEVSDQFAHLFGYKSKEMLGKSAKDFIAPTHQEDAMQKILSGHDLPYESVYVKKDGSEFPVEVCGKNFISHGRELRVAAIKDLTERKQAEETLKESETRFRAFFETAPIGMAIGEPGGRLLQVNHALQEMLGYPIDDQDAYRIDKISHPDHVDQDLALFAEVKAGKRDHYRLEKAFLRNDGSTMWGDLTISVVRDDQGDIKYTYAMIADITDRVQANKQVIQQAEDLELLNSLNEAVNQGASLNTIYAKIAKDTMALFSGYGATVFLLSEDSKYYELQNISLPTKIQNRIEKLIKFKIPKVKIELTDDSHFVDVVQKKTSLLIIDEDKIVSVIEEFTRAEEIPDSISKGFLSRLAPQIKTILKTKSIMAVPLVSEGVCIGFLQISHGEVFTKEDLNRYETIAQQLTAIIKRKHAEEALRESEENFRNLSEKSPNMIFIYQDGKVVYANEASVKVMGYSLEEFYAPDFDFMNLIAPESIDTVVENLRKHQSGGEVPPYEYQLITKDGQRLFAINNTRVIPYKGRTAILGIITDMTERMKAEEALRLTQFSINHASDSVFWIGPDSRFIFVSDTACHTLGYTREEMLNMQVSDIDPNFPIDSWSSHWEELKNRGSFTMESMHFTKDGRIFPVEITVNYLEFEGKEYNFAFARDLTGRVKAEEALHQSESRYRGIFEGVQDAIFVESLSGEILDVNASACKMYGYSREEFLQKSGSDLVPEGELTLWTSEVSSPDIPSQPVETINLRADGSPFPVEIAASRHTLGDEDVMLIVVRDITERKEVVRVLRENEERFRAVAQSAHDAIISSDNDGNVVFWNKGAETMFQYREDEVRGKSLAEFVPEIFKDTQILNSEATGRTFEKSVSGQVVKMNGVRKDGSEFPIEISMATWTLEDQVFHTTIIRDISERIRAEDQIYNQVQRLHALRRIDTAISASVDLKVTLDVILNQVLTQLKVDAADILKYNPSTQTLEFAAGRGFRTPALRHTRLSIGSGFAGRAVLERRTISVPNLTSSTQVYQQSPFLKDEGFVTYYGVPLISKGEVKGVLEIFNRSPLYPNEEWLDFLETLASQAGIAIENTTLFNNLQTANLELSLAYDRTIEGWSRALELRDYETEGHTQRVTEMTLKLAERLGIKDKDLAHIRRGCILHDIGKMSISDIIFKKSEPLSKEEWEEMRRHPIIAHQLLSPIPYLRRALDIPYCHHERWDGEGYPRGLKGEQIPIAARIFAVVDVWDALQSDRPYRAAWSQEKAREYIREQAGAHFDPAVVDEFFKMIDSFTPPDSGI